MEPLPGEAAPGPQRAAASAGFLLPAVLAFFLLTLLVLLRHEMWQDEWQVWLLVSDSPSLPELLRNLRYEGHPGLWYLGLFLLRRISPNPLAMQLLHLLVATAAVYVFLRYAPFSRLPKLLFIFGYFPFYEYAVISRNYGLGVLGLFSFCAVFCLPPPRNYLLLALILFLLCQTSVYGLMIAMVLGVILLGAAWRDRAAGRQAWAVLFIVLLGVGLAIIQLVPPPDSGFAVDWHFSLDLRRLLTTIATVWQSYVPIPAPDYHFWNTNFIPDPSWQALLAVMLLAFGLLLFIRQPVPLFLYAVGTAGILAFTYLKYPGSLRHHGHLFLLLIASLWLSASFPEKKIYPAFLEGGANFCRAHRGRILMVLLVAQLLAGVTAASLDLVFPFSASPAAARYIKEHHLDRLLILGHAADAASAVAGCLGRPLYYPASRRWGSFVVWDRRRTPDLEPEDLLKQAKELSRREHRQALLLLNYELPAGCFPVAPLQKFTDSLVPAENYYLYLAPAPGAE